MACRLYAGGRKRVLYQYPGDQGRMLMKQPPLRYVDRIDRIRFRMEVHPQDRIEPINFLAER